MADLQEIRRFWPKAVWWGKNMHAAANGLRGLLWIERVKVGLHRVAYVPENWGRKDFDGPTIAAAMAAAGFGERKVGQFRKMRLFLAEEDKGPWIPEDWKPYKTPLQSRQRPRKGVRLGKRGRRKARGLDRQYKPTGHDDMVDAAHWALLAQQRNDRGEIGQ